MESQSQGKPSSTMRAARNAALEFLQESLPDLVQADVTRIARGSAEPRCWEVEIQAWQPNTTIRAMGLTTERPVRDPASFLVRLDEELNVIEYGLKQLFEEG